MANQNTVCSIYSIWMILEYEFENFTQNVYASQETNFIHFVMFAIFQGKRLAMVGNSITENEEDHEVSDEDEAAEVQDETSQEKAPPKKKSKVKLSPLFSAVVGMKAVSYKGIEETLATGKISDIYIKSQIVFCPCNFNMKLCKSQIISVLLCMEQNTFKAPSFINHI